MGFLYFEITLQYIVHFWLLIWFSRACIPFKRLQESISVEVTATRKFFRQKNYRTHEKSRTAIVNYMLGKYASLVLNHWLTDNLKDPTGNSWAIKNRVYAIQYILLLRMMRWILEKVLFSRVSNFFLINIMCTACELILRFVIKII